jgi:hypothetical protein
MRPNQGLDAATSSPELRRPRSWKLDPRRARGTVGVSDRAEPPLG